MYHETFHQTYADGLDGWLERPFGEGLFIGDYHWKNGKRTIIIWQGSDGYTPTIVAYRVYNNDDDFRDYGRFDRYLNPPDCDTW